MTTLSKIKWVASILLVFAIVLTTNLIDKNNFNRLRYSVTTIYEDRIVANDLIFEMSILIQEKEIAVAMSDSSFFRERNEDVNLEIQGLITRYEQTKLTRQEQRVFNDFKNGLNDLKSLEQEYVRSGFKSSNELFEKIDEIIHHLYDLSKIQLHEGRRQVMISNETMEDIDVFTQGETIFLILMAIMVQIIILYKPKQKPDELS